MKNQEVARTFEKIADLLELRGNDLYRVRAYRRAAAEIDGLAENLDEINKRGELTQISGVGESIASKISDILSTGTTDFYEDLKKDFPEGLPEMMAIPGLGPQKVKKLYKRLGVRSVDELETAARQHRISRETDLGEKAEVSILQGIEMMRSGEVARISLGVALPHVEGVLAELRKVPGVLNASAGGSIRRCRDTIGDLDMVAETSDPEALISAFTKLPQVRDVIEAGASMAAVTTGGGRRMDLLLALPGHYGAALHHFTGSKQHNIVLRGMARERGLTINDRGVHRVDTGETIAAVAEKDIYAALDLPYIPPEIREDNGEIQAAREHRLPVLIEPADIHGDVHIHTKATDGGNTIEEMVEATRRLGYEYIAICDHSKSLTMVHGQDEQRLLAQVEEIRGINSRLKGFTVLTGVEVDIKADGTLDIDHSVLEKLDVVVGSLHYRYKQTPEQLTDRVLKALDTGLVDILAHPTGRIIAHRDPMDLDMDRIFEAALAHGTALEINSYPDRLDLNDIYARAAKERGLTLSIDTDAHNTAEFAHIRYGIMMARRGWLEASNVLNARPLDDLLGWLERRRPRGK